MGDDKAPAGKKPARPTRDTAQNTTAAQEAATGPGPSPPLSPPSPGMPTASPSAMEDDAAAGALPPPMAPVPAAALNAPQTPGHRSAADPGDPGGGSASTPATPVPGVAVASGTRLRSTAPEYRPRSSPSITPSAAGKFSTPPHQGQVPPPPPTLSPPATSAAPASATVPPGTPGGNTSVTSLYAGPMTGRAPYHGDCFVDYMLVVDFEATCEEPCPPDYVPEIIEFPVVAVDTANRKIVGEFHSYVRPTDKPVLSAFCRSLTGIEQDKVACAPPLQKVVDDFDRWLSTVVPDGKTFIFATDGPWDMRDFMHAYAVKVYNVRFPEYFYRWVDVKEAFADFYSCRRGKIHAMLDFFGLSFEGRLHSGIDDARNIARIVIALLEAGCAFPTVDEIDPTPPRGGSSVRRFHHNSATGTPNAGMSGSSPPDLSGLPPPPAFAESPPTSAQYPPHWQHQPSYSRHGGTSPPFPGLPPPQAPFAGSGGGRLPPYVVSPPHGPASAAGSSPGGVGIGQFYGETAPHMQHTGHLLHQNQYHGYDYRPSPSGGASNGAAPPSYSQSAGSRRESAASGRSQAKRGSAASEASSPPQLPPYLQSTTLFPPPPPASSTA